MGDEKPTKRGPGDQGTRGPGDQGTRGPGQNWNDPRKNGTCETVANNEKFNIV